MNKKPSGKFKPRSTRALSKAASRGWDIDQRTAQAKSIRQIKQSIREVSEQGNQSEQPGTMNSEP